MPKIGGSIVPKLYLKFHDRRSGCLEPVSPSANHHDYDGGE